MLIQRIDVPVLAPDVSFIAAERTPPGGHPRRGFVDGPPTLAVEVTSPGDSEGYLRKKTARYLEAGAERVWIVRPERRTVTIHRPNERPVTRTVGEALGSDDAGFRVAGFSLPLVELFS